MNNLEIKKQILDKIKEFDTILIHRHIRPDGDCLGSSFGLREILRASFPDKKVYSVGENDSEYLAFLGDEDKINDDLYHEALVIVVDTATSDRIYDERFKMAKFIIKMDHHIPVDDYGDINYVRVDLPATCALVTDFFDTFREELVLNKSAAFPLYVGLTTDTGRFRYRGVSGDVMRLAGLLLDHDLDLEYIFSRLYLKSKEVYKIQGFLYNNFKTTSNGVSYIYINKRMQRKFNVSPEGAASLVNSLDSIKGSLIWMIFVEQNDGSIRVRLRSRFITVDDIANKYNGGGHAQASGATVRNKKELKELLAIADEKLEKFKQENEELF